MFSWSLYHISLRPKHQQKAGTRLNMDKHIWDTVWLGNTGGHSLSLSKLGLQDNLNKLLVLVVSCGHHISSKLEVFLVKEENDQSRERLQCYTSREQEWDTQKTMPTTHSAHVHPSWEATDVFHAKRTFQSWKKTVLGIFFSPAFWLNATPHPSSCSHRPPPQAPRQPYSTDWQHYGHT